MPALYRARGEGTPAAIPHAFFFTPTILSFTFLHPTNYKGIADAAPTPLHGTRHHPLTPQQTKHDTNTYTQCKK